MIGKRFLTSSFFFANYNFTLCIAVCFDGIRAYDEAGSLIYKAGRDVCVELSYVNDNYLVMWTTNDDGESQYTFINNVQDNPDNWNSNTVVFQ